MSFDERGWSVSMAEANSCEWDMIAFLDDLTPIQSPKSWKVFLPNPNAKVWEPRLYIGTQIDK